MDLTRDTVANIALLARLAITADEMPTYVGSLSKILNFVAQLEAVETSAVEPMAHPLADQVQRLRPDVVTEADERMKYQQCASRVDAGLYLVPKVID
jgi:aspartyl-tRNA(Asn)/glutamyl-tRNA(Gln) amidotransferase subunit C